MPSKELTPEKIEEMKKLVEQVREDVIKDYEESKELYDEGDVQKIKDDDWYVTRFILRQRKDPEAAAEMLKSCMKWRKEFGIPEMKDTDFPEEFYKIGGIFPYGKDIHGNGIVHMRIKMHHKITELEYAEKHFLIHVLNKVDLEMDGKGMAIVFDCEGAGIKNVDMEMLWFLISTMIKYYPTGLAYVLVYDLPWVLNATWKVVKYWLPDEHRKLIKFADKNNINEYIANESLPDYMGGTSNIDYRIVPAGCRPVQELAKEKGINDDKVESIRKQFEKYLVVGGEEKQAQVAVS